MAPDLVRLIARRNVHGHEKKKESIQPPSRARLGACAQRSVGYTSRCTSIHIPGADAAEPCVGFWPSSQSEGSLFGTVRVEIRFSNEKLRKRLKLGTWI
jgi:hypothetical protein